MRPYIAYFILVVIALISFSFCSCTNNEGTADIDILTPVDSLQGTADSQDIPK